MNKAMIIGNLGAKPEIRYLSSGQAVAELRVATTERWKSRDGERQEKTEWHRCVIWGKAAENAARYLDKGSKVYCEGRLQTRSWDDKDGIKRYTTEIVIDRMEYLSTARGGGGEQAEGDSYSDAAPAGGGEADDDIPFDEPAPAAAPSSNRAPAKSAGARPRSVARGGRCSAR
jgi:single-strand DNA-binding protein